MKLEDLALNIVELQDEIEEQKKQNKIANLKCNINKIKAIVKLGITITIVPTIGTIIATKTGNNPFKLNEKEVPALITTIIDEDGNVEENKDYYYDTTTIYRSKLYYYTEWKKNRNNNYKRIKYEYTIKNNIDIEIITDIIHNNVNIDKKQLEELIKKNRDYNIGLVSKTEYKVYLTEEEINQKPHISAIINTKDEKDTIIRIETKEEHAEKRFFRISIEILIMSGPLTILYCMKYFERIMKDLKSTPDIKDTKKLEQKLRSKLLLLEQIQYQTIEEKEFEQLLNQEKTKKLRYKQGQF